MGLPAGFPGGAAGTHAQTTPAAPPAKVGPPGVGGAPDRGPGSTTHDGTPPHRYTAPRESSREGGAQAGRATLPSNGATRERPHHPVHSQASPLIVVPPCLGTPDALPAAGGGAIQLGRPSAGGTSLGGSRPSGPPGGTDGNRPGAGTRGHAGGHRGCPTGPPPGNRWKRTWNRHMWGRRMVHGTPRPPRRAPWKRTSPRQPGRRGSHPKPVPPDHGPGPEPPRTPQGCGSAQCRGAHAARGLADGVGMPAVVGIPPPLSAPIDRCGPAGRTA